jgi:hypothetical protein
MTTKNGVVTTAKVSATQQRKNRKEEREQKEAERLLKIQQLQEDAKLRKIKALFLTIAEEAAVKSVIVSARIETAKEVERIKQEAEQKRIELAKKAARIEKETEREKKKQYFAKLDNYLSFLPEDAKRKHESYCHCDECRALPKPREYILAIKENSAHSINKEVYIFLLPESFKTEQYNLAQFAIQHKYQLFDFPHYTQSKESIQNCIHCGDKYQIIGLDKEKGVVKPFDTYLNPEFWSGVNGVFKKTIEERIANYYHQENNQKVTFKTTFYRNYSTNEDNDGCFHVDGECPYYGSGSIDCPKQPQERSTFEPTVDTFGEIIIPFELTNSCCENNKKNCVLVFYISYINCKIGISICKYRTNSSFYKLSELGSISIDKIQEGMFKSEFLCKECKLEVRKENAMTEVSESFTMDPDLFDCTTTTHFISKNQQLIGDVKYPFHIITGNCNNWCINNRKSEPSYDSDKFSDSDDSYYSDQCWECSAVKSFFNSGDVVEVKCKEFSIYKFPEQSENSKQIVPNYLFEWVPFSQRDIEMYYLITVCLGKLPNELIKYIFKFLTPQKRVSRKQLVQLKSLEKESNNLTLIKSILRTKKLYKFTQGLI